MCSIWGSVWYPAACSYWLSAILLHSWNADCRRNICIYMLLYITCTRYIYMNICRYISHVSRQHSRCWTFISNNGESTIVSEGFKGGTRGAPIMPRDVSLSDSTCWNGGHEWVGSETVYWRRLVPCFCVAPRICTDKLIMNLVDSN